MTADTGTTYPPARLGAHELVAWRLMPWMARAQLAWLARDLPDAGLQLVQGAGHHLPRRAPDAVADAIAAFLAATEEADKRVERRSLTVGGRRRVKAAIVRAGPPAPAGTADAYHGCG